MEMLVCPRDGGKLREEAGHLVCPSGHQYPVFEGIPILVLGDVEQTHWAATRAISIAQGVDELEDFDPEIDGIHPFVKRAVPATSGFLYLPIADKMTRYPIPELRLPPGEGKLLLDVGCNWGRWTIAAAQKGYRTIGLDPSLDAVLVARSVCRQLGVEAEFVVADARFIPFAPETFDTIFSFGVLQHLSKEDVRTSLASIKKALKRGGNALVQMASALGVRSFYQQAKRGFRTPKAFEVRYWTPGELRDAFERLIGPAKMSVDGFFGLGIQAADLDLMPWRYRVVIRTSEALRAVSRKLPLLNWTADSLYLESRKA